MWHEIGIFLNDAIINESQSNIKLISIWSYRFIFDVINAFLNDKAAFFLLNIDKKKLVTIL